MEMVEWALGREAADFCLTTPHWGHREASHPIMQPLCHDGQPQAVPPSMLWPLEMALPPSTLIYQEICSHTQ